MNVPVEWLLEGEPYIQFRTRLDLMGQPEDNREVTNARAAMLASPPVQSLLEGLNNWPGTVISSHKSAGQPYHRLTFLADLGLTTTDPGIEPIIARVLAHRDPAGPFQLPAGPAVQSGGEQAAWGWALCDAPLSLYALICFGLQQHPAVQLAAAHLAGLVRANGWPCAVSAELGSWRGPGRKDDPCPFATLAMLKALSGLDAYRDSPACRNGAQALLDLWQHSASSHPYIFYMGTDFRKLKVPFVWYDLLHVLDVLTRFPWLRNDARLQEMLALLSAKADADGRFTSESIWAAWKDWEFGQKKTPSRWLTLLAWRILLRAQIS